jgi:membrane associated rhomboid family serine protease
MILPLGDAPNPRGFRAWVTWLLMAANVSIYLWMLSFGFDRPAADDPALLDFLRSVGGRLGPREIAHLTLYDLVIFEHGFRPGAASWADLFSAMFLHAGFSHLAGNMLFLWIYGDNIEHRLGRLWYLGLYLGGGAAATLSFAWFAADPMVPLVGASGAISAVLGAYLVFYPHNVVRLWMFFFPFFQRIFDVPAWMVLWGYVLFDNLLPVLFGGDGAVAHGAHLGGFVAGWGVAQALPWGPARGGPEDRGEALLSRAEQAAHEGDAVLAFNLAREAARRTSDPEVAAAARELARGLRG